MLPFSVCDGNELSGSGERDTGAEALTLHVSGMAEGTTSLTPVDRLPILRKNGYTIHVSCAPA